MKNNNDLAQKWLKMAEEEIAAAQTLLETGVGLAAVCFHCQQAGEKSIKAWLIAHDIEPPKTHKLEELIELCSQREPHFHELRDAARTLTPYAVEARYDADFWPSLDEARTALEQSRPIYDFVKSHWN